MIIEKRKEVFKMVVEGKIKVNGYLRMCDLCYGEAFAFEDDSRNLFMITDEDFFVHLETGEIIDFSQYEDRPVKRIKAKIVIED